MTDHAFTQGGVAMLSDDELLRRGLTRQLNGAEAHVTSDDCTVRLGALQQKANVLILTGRIAEAERATSTLLDLALKYGSADARANAWVCRGRLDYLRGAYSNARRSLNLVLDIGETHEDLRADTEANALRTLRASGLLATTAFLQGNKRGAINAMRSAYALAMESGRPHVLGTLHTLLAEFHQIRDEPDQARDAAMEASAIAEVHGFDALLNDSSLHYWIADGTLEPNADAASNIESLLALRRALGMRLREPYFLNGLAQVNVGLGRYETARDTVDDAIDIAMLYGERGHLAMLLNERARIRSSADSSRHQSSTADAKKAFYIAASQQARHLQHVALSLLPLRDQDTAHAARRADAPAPC